MEDILNIAQSYIMPTIDLILFAVMLYYAYKLVKGTAAINIFLGFVIIYIIGTNKNTSIYIRIQKGVNNKIVTIAIGNNII